MSRNLWTVRSGQRTVMDFAIDFRIKVATPGLQLYTHNSHISAATRLSSFEVSLGYKFLFFFLQMKKISMTSVHHHIPHHKHVIQTTQCSSTHLWTEPPFHWTQENSLVKRLCFFMWCFSKGCLQKMCPKIHWSIQNGLHYQLQLSPVVSGGEVGSPWTGHQDNAETDRTAAIYLCWFFIFTPCSMTSFSNMIK